MKFAEEIPGVRESLTNAFPEHRAAVIAALRDEGINAYEYQSGGGLTHVAVDMVNEPNGDLLQIATGDIDSPCDVSLMGWRDGESVCAREWRQAPMLPDAVAAFKSYLADRDAWVRRFHAGELDL